MKKLFLILIANFCLGANLLQYELFDHEDNVDIVLSFDSSYKLDITRKVDNQSMTLILKNLGSDEKYNEMRTNQKVLKGFTITPKGNNVEINFPTGANLIVGAVPGEDNLKLTLNVKNPNFDQSQMSASGVSEENAGAQSQNRANSRLGWILPAIIALLFVGVIMVFVRKIKAFKPRKSIDDTWEKFDSSVLEKPDNDDLNEVLNRNLNDGEISDEIAQNISFEQAPSDEKSWQELAQNDESEEKFTYEIQSEISDKISDEIYEQNENFAEPTHAKFAPFSPKSDFNTELKERLEAKDSKVSAFKNVLQDEILEVNVTHTSNVSVEFVKEIDEKNTAVVLSYGGKKHLVVLKNTNIIE